MVTCGDSPGPGAGCPPSPPQACASPSGRDDDALLLRALFPGAVKRYITAALDAHADMEAAVRRLHGVTGGSRGQQRCLIQSLRDTQPVEEANVKVGLLLAEGAERMERLRRAPIAHGAPRRGAYSEVVLAFPVDTSSWDAEFIPPPTPARHSCSGSFMLPGGDGAVVLDSNPSRTPTFPWVDVKSLPKAARTGRTMSATTGSGQGLAGHRDPQHLSVAAKASVTGGVVSDRKVRRSGNSGSESNLNGIERAAEECHRGFGVDGPRDGPMNILEFTVMKERQWDDAASQALPWSSVFSRGSRCFVFREIVLQCSSTAAALPDLVVSSLSVIERELCGRDVLPHPTRFVCNALCSEYDVEFGPVRVKTVELGRCTSALEDGGKHLRVCLKLRRIVLEPFLYSYRKTRSKASEASRGSVSVKVKSTALSANLIIVLAADGSVNVRTACDHVRVGAVSAKFSRVIPSIFFFFLKPVIRRRLKKELKQALNSSDFLKT